MAGTSKADRTGPYEQIYRRIIEGVYRPGERLIEQRIAEELAVSRTPVREALVRLEGAGLVVNARHKGAMVRALTRDDIVDLYELRATLESLAAKRAAIRADEAEIARMDEAIDAFDAAITGPWPATIDQLRELNAANRQFHDALAASARNETLAELQERLTAQVHTLPATTLSTPGRWPRACEEHRLIMRAVEDRDSATARSVAKQHMTEARDIRIRLYE